MKTNKPEFKISIVIPVYNAQNYISHLIESLKAQTFKELEFIFVDDCSEDESMLQVEEWAKDDARVNIIRNEVNLGEGGSRNKGIEAARGIYINTIDPDDWVAPDFYELLWAKAEETSADIVKGTRIKISEETHKELVPRSKLNDVITASLAKGEPLYLRMHYEHQTIIFKQTLLARGVRYGKSGNAADTTFLLKLCSESTTFTIEDRAYYYYLQRKTAATGEFSFRRSRNEMISFEEQIEHFLPEKQVDIYAYRYCSHRFNTYISRFIQACEEGKVTKEQKKQYADDLKALLTRLPNYENLYKLDSRIMAIIELEIVPMKILSAEFTVCRDEVSDYMTYIMALDGEEKEKVCKKMENMLVSYIKERMCAGAAFRTARREIKKMESELKNEEQKNMFHSIAEDVFARDFPDYRKTIVGLFSRLGKQRS